MRRRVLASGVNELPCTSEMNLLINPTSSSGRRSWLTSASMAITNKSSRARLEFSERELDQRSKEVITGSDTETAFATPSDHSRRRTLAGEAVTSLAGGTPTNPTRPLSRYMVMPSTSSKSSSNLFPAKRRRPVSNRCPLGKRSASITPKPRRRTAAIKAAQPRRPRLSAVSSDDTGGLRRSSRCPLNCEAADTCLRAHVPSAGVSIWRGASNPVRECAPSTSKERRTR